MSKEDKLMSKKYTVLKINKEVIPNSRMVDSPYMKTRESEELAKAGAKLVEVSAANNVEVIQALKNADIILLGNAPITRWIIESAPKCVAIISGGVGYDPIDVQAATDNNILVVNNPAFEWCVEQVSNHAIVLMLALAKKTGQRRMLGRCQERPIPDGFHLRTDPGNCRLWRHRQNGRPESTVFRHENNRL